MSQRSVLVSPPKKSCELLKFGEKGLPEGLMKVLDVPKYVQITNHVLSPYARENLRAVIPTQLEVVLVQDLPEFYEDALQISWGGLTGCKGLYLALNHLWAPDVVTGRALDILKEKYGADVSEAIVLPLYSVNYRTFVHEALHAIFNRMTQEQREAIIESARRSYSGFMSMQQSIPFLLNLEFDDADFKIWEERRKLSQKPVHINEYCTFDKLTPNSRLKLVDEFIACSYTCSLIDCPGRKPLPIGFRNTLTEIGYDTRYIL